MGSSGFTDAHPATDRVAVAYMNLKDAASREFGYDPYNGSISTTDGVTVPTDQVMTFAEAELYHNERMDVLRKGECEALRIGVRPLLSTRTVIRELRVPHGTTREAFAAENVSLKSGEHIASMKLLLAESATPGTAVAITGRTEYRPSPQATSIRTVSVVAGKEGTETRFFIIGLRQQPTFPTWEKGHPTQAAARAALVAALPKETLQSEWFDATPTTYEIVSMTRRVDGTALVTATVTPVASKGRYSIVIEKHGDIGPQTEWFFYGWASC